MKSEHIDLILKLATAQKQFTEEFARPEMLYLLNDIKAIKLFSGNLLLTEIGKNILAKGSWEEYQNSKQELENLEIRLAKSNLKANKLNEQIAIKNEKNERKNQIISLINILIGIVNVVVLLWQTLKN